LRPVASPRSDAETRAKSTEATLELLRELGYGATIDRFPGHTAGPKDRVDPFAKPSSNARYLREAAG
jgi:hypothetical protein